MQAFNHEILSIATGPAAPLFPPLNQEEREILSQIIKLTPPNTNAFNALLSPYENTLRRYRIDPKIDDKYYTFLLKLSLVPGSDWKQKWARVLSDQAISSGLPPKQAIVPTATQVHPTAHDPRRIKQTVYSGTQDKEKWKAINSNVKPATHQTAAHSKSRPPKSVHFLPSKAEENDHNQIKEPPAARDLSLPVELQSEIIQSKMTLLIDPIDVKARKFRREQLLARCMNKWMNSIIYWNTLNSEAQSARRVLDISTAHQTWTRKFRNRENKLKLVDTSYNTRLLSSHLDQWRKLTVSRTIQKKSLALRNAYRKTKGTRERNLGRQVLIIWANYMKSTRMYNSSDRRVIYQSLSNWYQKLQYLSHLSHAADNLLSKFDSIQLHRILSQWFQEALLRSKLRNFLHGRDSQVKHQVFINWKISLIQSRQSHFFLLKSRFHRLLKACSKFRARQRRLEFSESTVLAFRSSNTQLHVLRYWIISGRGRLFAKLVQTRLMRMLLQRWRRRTAHVHHILPRLQNQFTVQWTVNLANHHLQHWIQYHHALIQHSAQAQHFHKLHAIRESFLAWTFRHWRTQQLQTEASSTRIYFLRKRVLIVWKRRIQRIRVNLWRQEKTLAHLRDRFTTWRLLFHKRRRLSISLWTFDQRSAERQCMNAIFQWRIRLTLTIRNEQTAVEFAQRNLIQRFWVTWTDRHQLIRVLIDESSLVIHRRYQTQKSTLLAYWLDRTRIKVAHNFKLGEFSNRRHRAMIMCVWEKWRDKIRSRELEPLEQTFNLMRDRNSKTQIMQLWIARSSLLFLIRQKKQNTLIDCFKLWYNLTQSHKLHNRFNLRKNRLILKFFFSLWCKKSIDLKTMKIISRFKNNLRIAQPTTRNTRRLCAREVTEEDYTTTTSLTNSSSNETYETSQ
ncbi:hypothetical protein PGT21_034556 [Puccinia graminis f. sp. tritici]|uniref:Sfi1 spindle body domain-containing protein n=1 Tax=Puccinia graminis f. sp. tritici TaxID=56615 RepID=A0A5B0MJY7_PUCGR|nr:hypothetical protein PGTUg99_036004 [Puccinia graminis f. sp. tritici]KAA1091481.1 hypothetical protein PGT21_034556 [Puccinia graminis f. sp. tritici]